MSTDYTHFDNLAFNRLFARGPDGGESVIYNSSGAFVGLLTATLSVNILLVGDGLSSAVSLGFKNDTDTGFYRTGSGVVGFVSNATDTLKIGSGQLVLVNGTAPAPSYSFLNDSDSGIFLKSANVVGLAAGGIEIASISTATITIAKTITATNLSGTNTGDVTIGTANGLSLVSQAISMAAAASATIGVLTASSQSLGGNKTLKGLLSVGGATIAAGNVLSIGGTGFTSGTDQIAANATLVGSTAATNSLQGYNSNITTAAAGFTCGFRIGFYHTNTAKGAGSTIGRDIGHLIEMPTQGGTSNVAICDNFTSSGSYFIHSTSTNPSLLTGYLQISNQADPGAVTDGVRLGSVDLSAGNATLALRTETAVVTETVVSDRTLSVQINGTTYKICLKV